VTSCKLQHTLTHKNFRHSGVLIREKEVIASQKGIHVPASERNDRFAFLHEQTGDDADDADEEEVDPEEQDQDE
jgi:hypothetical protein